MSLPTGFTLVPVVAGANGYFYRDAAGTKAEGGRVVFVSLSRDVVVDGISLPKKLVATLDANGQIPDDFVLPTCVDAVREINGVYYRVTEDFPGGRAPFDIFVASDATSIDMATVAPVAELPEWASAAQSPAVAEVLAQAATSASTASTAASTATTKAAEAAASAQAATDAQTNAEASALAASDSADAAAASAMAASDSADLAEAARLLGATIGFATKADMDADLAHDAGTLALVTNDDVDPAANNGAYRKSGGIGLGSWVKSADRVSGIDTRLASLEGEELPDRVVALEGEVLAIPLAQEDILRKSVEQPNLFSRAQLDGTEYPYSMVSGTITPVDSDGINVWRLSAVAGGSVRVIWRFDRSLIPGDTCSTAFLIETGDAGTAGNFARLVYRDSNGALISTSSGDAAPALAVTDYTVKQEGATIPANTAYIDVDIQFVAQAGSARSVDIRGMVLCAGSSAQFRAPDDHAEVADLANIVTEVKSSVNTYVGNLAYLPAAISAALAVGGASFVQDFHSGALSVSHPERNEASESASKTTYYVSSTGNNANDGLSRSTPKKSLATLINSLAPTTDVEIIIIGGPQIFYRDDSLAGASWDHPYHLSIVAENEALITSSEKPTSLSWIANGTAWQATRSAVGMVFDAGIRDYRGVPLRLTEVASLAAVQAETGTWYTDGTTVYVRLHDDRTPDANVLVLLNTGVFNAVASSGKTIYLENLKIGQHKADSVGSSFSVDPGDTGYVTAINCAFFGADNNGVNLLRVSFGYLRDCTAMGNRYDGFNYHDNIASPQSVILEVNCHGYDNGNLGDTGGTYNGSTAHDGLTIIRVNPMHYNCFGAVIADVNGCKSFNVNGFAGPTSLTGVGNTRASWYFDNASAVTPGETWLIGCGAADSLYDIHADDPATVIKVRGWKGGSPNVGPNASITKF